MKGRLILLATLLALAGGAQADTITVMKDGSGDFTQLQPAADSAAPGDTILIGPGRYDEITPYTFPSGVRKDAHLLIRRDSLTIIGTSRDDVIIGPAVPDYQQVDGYPVGIIPIDQNFTTRIESLSIEHVVAGIYGIGNLKVSECLIQSCYEALAIEGDLELFDCDINTSVDTGVRMTSKSGSGWIENCRFEGNAVFGIIFNRTLGRGDVKNTVILGGIVGVQYDQVLGSLSKSTIEGVQNGAVALVGGASVTVTDCVFLSNGAHIDFGDLSTLIGTANRLGRFNVYGIRIGTAGDLTWNGNDFADVPGYAVWVGGHSFLEPVHYDFTGNYWGTSDPDTIAARIYDFNDDINVRAIIDFEPFSGESVPVEESSMGQFKAGFGGH